MLALPQQISRVAPQLEPRGHQRICLWWCSESPAIVPMPTFVCGFSNRYTWNVKAMDPTAVGFAKTPVGSRLKVESTAVLGCSCETGAGGRIHIRVTSPGTRYSFLLLDPLPLASEEIPRPGQTLFGDFVLRAERRAQRPAHEFHDPLVHRPLAQ